MYCVIYSYIGKVKDMLDIRQDVLYISFLNYMKYNCLENEEEEVDEQAGLRLKELSQGHRPSGRGRTGF